MESENDEETEEQTEDTEEEEMITNVFPWEVEKPTTRKSERQRQPTSRYRDFQRFPQDCGDWKHCLDKPRFGGSNKLKKKCLQPKEAKI